MSRKPLSEAVERAWVRLVRAGQATLGAVEADLKVAGFPPLAWYDILLELRRSGEGLRPFEIEEKLLLAQHNVSRLVDRLERAGYAERRPIASDGRGQVVAITPEGRQLLERMWPTYCAAIQRHVGSRLKGDKEAKALASLLGKLIGR